MSTPSQAMKYNRNSTAPSSKIGVSIVSTIFIFYKTKMWKNKEWNLFNFSCFFRYYL